MYILYMYVHTHMSFMHTAINNVAMSVEKLRAYMYSYTQRVNLTNHCPVAKDFVVWREKPFCKNVMYMCVYVHVLLIYCSVGL